MNTTKTIFRIICLALLLTLACCCFVGCNEEEPVVEEQPKPIEINVGSYNIANGRNVDHDFSIIAQDILDFDLDIVGLQEVDINVERSKNKDTMAELSTLTGYEHYAYFKTIDLGVAGQYGVAVLSKYPILETETFEMPSPNVERRVLGYAKIDVNGTPINFFVTHCSCERKDIRVDQFAFINEKMKEYDNFVIVADYNTSDFEEYKVFDNASTLNTAETNVVTYERGTSIDNFVYSTNDWTFEPPAMVDNKHSDHNLLYSKGTFLLNK